MTSEAERWVTVAVLGRPRGNRGELTAVGLSGGLERYKQLRDVYLFPGDAGAGGDGSRYEVESVWEHGGRLILKLRGVDTISDAERLRGAEVRVPRSDRAPAGAGEFYHSDLVGCEVIERDGNVLGRVTGLQETGPAPLLELENGLLIPFARSICVEIDPAARRIVVELPKGLKELNQP